MADYFRKYKSLYSSTSNSFGTGTGETITPNSVSGLPTDTEIVLTFDRVNSQGVETPSLMERIKGTISGGNFVIATGGRGYDGTTEQAHTSPVVEQIWNAKDLNDIVTGIITEHNQNGTHGAITSSSVVTFTNNVKLADAKSVVDGNSNEWIKFSQTASAVNEFTVANAATGLGPILSATGGDSTIAPAFTGKSAFGKHYGLYDCGTVGATETVNWRNGDRQKLTLDENLTITFSNAVAGQTITLYMLQDGSGTNTITFADTLVWADNTTPTWTTTASKMNIAVIFYDGSAYYGVGNKFA